MGGIELTRDGRRCIHSRLIHTPPPPAPHHRSLHRPNAKPCPPGVSKPPISRRTRSRALSRPYLRTRHRLAHRGHPARRRRFTPRRYRDATTARSRVPRLSRRCCPAPNPRNFLRRTRCRVRRCRVPPRTSRPRSRCTRRFSRTRRRRRSRPIPRTATSPRKPRNAACVNAPPCARARVTSSRCAACAPRPRPMPRSARSIRCW